MTQDQLLGKEGVLRWMGAGLLAGFAVSVKWSAVVALAAALPALWPLRRRAKHFGAAVALLLAGVVLGFTLGCPYWLRELFSPAWHEVSHDLAYESVHYRLGHLGMVPVALQTPWRRVAALWPMLAWGAGRPLALLWLAGLAAAPRGARTAALRWVSLAAFALLATSPVKFPRHLVVVYPLLAILAGQALARWSERTWCRALLAGVLLWGLAWTGAFARVWLQPPTTLQAADWLARHGLTASIGPDLPLCWLAPADRVVTSADLPAAMPALVPDALLPRYRDFAAHPEHRRRADWYPRSDHDPAAVARFQALATARQPLARFRARPGWGRWSLDLGGAPPPFGLLLHPDLTVYGAAAP